MRGPSLADVWLTRSGESLHIPLEVVEAAESFQPLNGGAIDGKSALICTFLFGRRHPSQAKSQAKSGERERE